MKTLFLISFTLTAAIVAAQNRISGNANSVIGVTLISLLLYIKHPVPIIGRRVLRKMPAVF